MTRGTIPRFDLYEELEVSRQASPDVIEAAYRTLVKRYHPDVAGGKADERAVDAERIKRLNVAHGWLADPAKRARYDEANPASSKPGEAVKAPTDVPGEPQPDLAPGGFGPNTAAVRQFLADLRPLDWSRALEVAEGKGAIGTTEYAEARGSALAASRATGRHDQWLLARDAATVIAKGKLREGPAVAEVAGIVADVAGALVVRDVMPLADFHILLAPWTWRPAAADTAKTAAARTAAARTAWPGAAAGASAAASRVVPVHAAADGAGVRGRRRPVAIGVAATALVAILGVALLGGVLPKPLPADQAAVASTGLSAAAASEVALALPDVTPPATLVTPPPFTSGPSPTLVAVGPSATPFDPTAGPTPAPTPLVTPRPTPPPTPKPTPKPTPAPTPTPTPTPVPTPSPKVICTVPNLLNDTFGSVQATWAAAGFTGTVTYLPAFHGSYRVMSQSPSAGTDVLCISGLTVTNVAPTPSA